MGLLVCPDFKEVKQRLQVSQKRYPFCFVQGVHQVMLGLHGACQRVLVFLVAEHFEHFILDHLDSQVEKQRALCQIVQALLGGKGGQSNQVDLVVSLDHLQDRQQALRLVLIRSETL